MHSGLREFSTTEGPIRHSFNDRIQEYVDDALKELDKDTPVAVVGHIHEEGWKVSAAARIGDQWSIMAYAFDEWKDPDFNVGAKVVWTPKLNR